MRRLLALSGGGVRGIIEVAFLQEIERVYRERRGPDARLCDVFDLVGGTSTGALIAAAIAIGLPVKDVASFYLERAPHLFSRGRRWLFGLAPIFDSDRLESEIRSVVGDVALGDPVIRARLVIVAKRLDTGSPWILCNIPGAPFYDDPPDGSYIGNRHYPLARILRASAAAPTYFRQQIIEVIRGEPPGVFVDGGASPFNDPSLALLMVARMRAYGLCWPSGPDKLFLLSIGTGRWRRRVPPDRAARAGPLRLTLDTLSGLIADGEQHSLTMLEWIGHSRAPSTVNSELGHLGDDFAFGVPQFSFLRLDVPLEQSALSEMGIYIPEREITKFRVLDDPGIIPELYDIAREVCVRHYNLNELLP